MKPTWLLLVLSLLLASLGTIQGHAAPRAPLPATVPVTLKLNTSRVFPFPDRITRIQVINPRVADVSQVQARRLTLTGRALGQTRVEVVFRRHKVILQVTVVR